MTSNTTDALKFFPCLVLWVSYLDVYSLNPEERSSVYWAPDWHSAGCLLLHRRTIRGQLSEAFASVTLNLKLLNHAEKKSCFSLRKAIH